MAQTQTPTVEVRLPRGRTLAFRPLTPQQEKKGMKYQVFETSVTSYLAPDTSIRDSTSEVSDLLLSKVADGYTLSTTARSSRRYVNDTVQNDPLGSLPLGLTATMKLRSDGTAYDFNGMEAIADKIKKLYSSDSAAVLLKGFNSPASRQRVINEWNGRLRSLLNREMVIGDASFDTSEVQLPSGHRLPAYIISRIEDTIRIQGTWHVKVRISAATYAKDLAEVSGMPLKDIIRGLKLADTTLAEYPLSMGTMTMSTDILVEMNTLKVKTEEFRRVFQLDPELRENDPVFTRSITYRRSLRYQY